MTKDELIRSLEQDAEFANEHRHESFVAGDNREESYWYGRRNGLLAAIRLAHQLDQQPATPGSEES